MKQDNYISFAVVAGFFIGLIISMIKFSAPEWIILWTLVCTCVAYLFALFMASLYMKFIDYDEKKINIRNLDTRLEYYLSEFDRREKEALSIRKYLKRSLSSANES